MAKQRRRRPRYHREAAAEASADSKSGRIPADLAAQAPNNSYGPPLYYEDYEFICTDCGRRDVWTAAQQKWWFEVAKGSVYARAVRCRACRMARNGKSGSSPSATGE